MSISSQDAPESVFAAFDPGLFVEGELWERTHAILEANRGGNYGLSGPRGAGKSWLVQRAVSYANSTDGLGVWFPSPSEYDAKAFLSSLSEVVAQRYIERYLEDIGAGTETGRRRRARLMLLVLFVTYVATLILLLIGVFREVPVSVLGAWSLLVNPWIIASFVTFCAGLIVAMIIRRAPRRSSSDVLYDRAQEVRTQARYSAALKEIGELSAGASRYGLTAGLKRSRETDLAERPATVSSLVHGLREFTEQLAKHFHAPIVIGIDELDKMEDPQQVAALLRDVKGIFDVKGIHYFVSISDEAGRVLDLGAVQGRNEFHSSFYQVFQVEPATTEFYSKMLKSRGVGPPSGFEAISIASCGVPREFLRIADSIEGERKHTESVASRIARLEVEAFNQDLQNGPGSNDAHDEKLLAAYEVGEALLDAVRYGVRPSQVLSEFWSPTFAEESADAKLVIWWRRVVVRAALMSCIGGIDDCDGLQKVSRVAQGSPLTARRMLEALLTASDATSRKKGAPNRWRIGALVRSIYPHPTEAS